MLTVVRRLTTMLFWIERCEAPHYAERRLRPLARRRFRIICPARVDMRARKPCLRLRRRTLGWYVRFTVELSR